MSKIVSIEARTLPEGWEKSLLACLEHGVDQPTEYDKDGDPPSKDITLILHVTNPEEEPRIHRAMPGGIEDLEKYRMEVVEGISDHLINPAEGKWAYTYSDSLFNYDTRNGPVNQIEYIVNTLSKDARSRRAQAILWDVDRDAIRWPEHPSCLQRLWCRINEENLLDMHVSMRSNDAYKAAFMNMYAFVGLQWLIVKEISKRIGHSMVIGIGSYVHMVDSFHIYGSYFDEVLGFVESVKNRTWEERTYNTKDVQYIIDETHEKYK